MIVREDRRRFLLDFAQCILEGIGWKQMGTVLYQQYGHVNEKTGKPFAQATLFRMAYNPVLWGNNARLYHDSKTGAWAFDASIPPPDGIEIIYGTHESAYTGELAYRVQNELRRRTTLVGRALPFRSHRFSGLLYCDECHKAMCFSLGVKVRGVHLRYYRCESRWRDPVYRAACSQKKHIQESAVQAQLDAIFRALIGTPDAFNLLLQTTPGNSLPPVDLGTEIRKLETQISQLIHLQSSAPENTQKLYTAQIEEVSARLATMTTRLENEARASVRSRQSLDAARQLQDVLSQLDVFWAKTDTEINQVLHAIFGEYKLIVRGGRIVAITRP